MPTAYLDPEGLDDLVLLLLDDLGVGDSWTVSGQEDDGREERHLRVVQIQVVEGHGKVEDGVHEVLLFREERRRVRLFRKQELKVLENSESVRKKH